MARTGVRPCSGCLVAVQCDHDREPVGVVSQHPAVRAARRAVLQLLVIDVNVTLVTARSQAGRSWGMWGERVGDYRCAVFIQVGEERRGHSR